MAAVQDRAESGGGAGRLHVHVATAADRWVPAALAALAALLMLARLWLVFKRLFDPDELEHLHAGYCLWQGLVPYRDFFEHHGPILWNLSLPLFWLWGASLQVLFAGRVLVWLLGAATVALTWSIANRLYGRWAAAVASVLLLTLPAYQEKNIEWRPDNVAVALLMVAVWVLTRGGRWAGLVRPALAGASLAAAFMCTQKSAYLAAGLVIGLAWAADRDWYGGRRRWLPALLAGAAVAGAAMLLPLLAEQALGPLVQMTVIWPLHWPVREPLLPHLVATVSPSPLFWALAVAGLIVCIGGLISPIRSVSKNGPVAGRSTVPPRAAEAVHCRLGIGATDCQRPVASALGAGLAAHLLGLLLVPAAFKQYYLLATPVASILASRGMLALAPGLLGRGVPRPATRWRVAALAAAAAVGLVAMAARTGYGFLSAGWSVAIAVFVAVAAILLWLRAGRCAVFTLLAANLVGGWPFVWVQYRWSHEEQSRVMERLMAATDPEDRFLDGFTGYGALRPHAFRFFWINDHSWPLVPEWERTAGLLRAVEDQRTRVVLYDRYLREHLPVAVQRYVWSQFRPDLRFQGPGCLVLMRRPDRSGRGRAAAGQSWPPTGGQSLRPDRGAAGRPTAKDVR